MPLDSYWNPNYGILSNTNCTYGSIIRDCITAHLTRFRNQGATGVRFFFGLGGGGYSTAFNTNGTVRQAWLNNLDQFFVDLINLGYGKVTPTAVLGFWSGDSASFYTDVPVSTCGGTKTLRLMRWLPYGLTTTNYWPDCQDDNNGYTNGAANTNFWGWSPYLNLVGAILQKAQQRGLTVADFDMVNEIHLLDFTIQGRLIYDNTTSTDVLGAIRTKMVTYMGGGADAHVTSSTAMTNPNTDGFDCGSVYGDTALIINESELTAAYANGLIGIPSGFSNINGLACGGNGNGMFRFPVYYSRPTVNNLHVHICIPNGSGGCILQGDPSSTFGSATARNVYNGVWNFFTYRGFTTHTAMLGEVNHSQDAVCDGYNKSMAFASSNGFNGYGGTSSSLYLNAAAQTIFRPWENEESACYVLVAPNTINPPYAP
jgi:hypothetical protein